MEQTFFSQYLDFTTEVVLVKLLIAVTVSWEKEDNERSCLWAHNFRTSWSWSASSIVMGPSQRQIILGGRSDERREVILLGS